jgi:hypothetical protein
MGLDIGSEEIQALQGMNIENPKDLITKLRLRVTTGGARNPFAPTLVSRLRNKNTFGATNTTASTKTRSVRVVNLNTQVHSCFERTCEVLPHATTAICKNIVNPCTIEVHVSDGRDTVLSQIWDTNTIVGLFLDVSVVGLGRQSFILPSGSLHAHGCHIVGMCVLPDHLRFMEKK